MSISEMEAKLHDEVSRLKTENKHYQGALDGLFAGAKLSLSIGKDVNAEWVMLVTKQALKGE